MNDASGVGAIDDALLPLIAVGLLATHLLMQPPPSVPEFVAAWQEVVVAMEAVGREADKVRKEAARQRAIPARKNCEEHLKRCLETPLSRPHTGSTYGKSICYDCWEACRGQNVWPDSTEAGKPCRWWEWIDMTPREAIRQKGGVIRDPD
jgi:hypothetical protein